MFRFASALLTGVICLSITGISSAQQTPPIPPKTVDTPLPAQITIPPATLPADVPSRPLTVDEAVLIALKHQPTVAEAQAAVAAAQGRTEQARSGLLPQVSLGGSYTKVQILSGNTGNPGESSGAVQQSLGEGITATAGVRQLIFDFNHTIETVLEAASQEKATSIDLTRVQSDLVLQVKQAYYNYVEAKRQITVNQANIQNRQAQLDLAQARLKSGLGLASDVLTAETAYDQAIISLNEALNSLSTQRVNLAQLLGIDPRTPIETPDTDAPTLAANDVNAMVTDALHHRPEVLEAQATIDANRHGVSAARTNNAPVVSGNVQFVSAGDRFFPNNDDFSFGAQIAFTPFDGGLTQGLVKTARANLDSAHAALIAAQQQVISDVSQAYLNLKSAEERVKQADAENANALENVRIATGRYREGLGQFQDIITAQTFLFGAGMDQTAAHAAVDNARAALQHAIGASVPGK